MAAAGALAVCLAAGAADTLTSMRQLLTENKPLVLSGYFGDRDVSELAGSSLLEKEGLALVG